MSQTSDWRTQNNNLTGGVLAIRTNTTSSDPSLNNVSLSFDSELVPSNMLSRLAAASSVKLPENSIINVNANLFPGLYFWGKGTIKIGGYVLKDPCIYTCSDNTDQEIFENNMFGAYLKEACINLSSIPNDLKEKGFDYEAIGADHFERYPYEFSLEHLAYYLNWLEHFSVDKNFEYHCYTRYVDALWLRTFVERRDLTICTVRMFEIAYFRSQNDHNMPEMRRALCAFYLAKATNTAFSEIEKNLIEDCYEKYFLHYHQRYKPNWDFYPAEFMATLGYNSLPKAHLLLEWMGQHYEKWEPDDKSGLATTSRAAVAYLLDDEFSFSISDKDQCIETGRGPFKLFIDYQGELCLSKAEEDRVLSALSVLLKLKGLSLDSFYSSLDDFSWKNEQEKVKTAISDSGLNDVEQESIKDNIWYIFDGKLYLLLLGPSVESAKYVIFSTEGEIVKIREGSSLFNYLDKHRKILTPSQDKVFEETILQAIAQKLALYGDSLDMSKSIVQTKNGGDEEKIVIEALLRYFAQKAPLHKNIAQKEKGPKRSAVNKAARMTDMELKVFAYQKEKMTGLLEELKESPANCVLTKVLKLLGTVEFAMNVFPDNAELKDAYENLDNWVIEYTGQYLDTIYKLLHGLKGIDDDYEENPAYGAKMCFYTIFREEYGKYVQKHNPN